MCLYYPSEPVVRAAQSAENETQQPTRRKRDVRASWREVTTVDGHGMGAPSRAFCAYHVLPHVAHVFGQTPCSFQPQRAHETRHRGRYSRHVLHVRRSCHLSAHVVLCPPQSLPMPVLQGRLRNYLSQQRPPRPPLHPPSSLPIGAFHVQHVVRHPLLPCKRAWQPCAAFCGDEATTEGYSRLPCFWEPSHEALDGWLCPACGGHVHQAQ